jgi:hypothetical protein
MKRKRRFEFLLLLILVAAGSSICFQNSNPTRRTSNLGASSASSPCPKPRPEGISGPTILRWSSRGGCYAESDFYFELRTDKTGASWIALLCAYGSWHENLLEHEGDPGHRRGNYLASGRLNVKQTNQFLAALKATEPLMVRSQQFHTSSVTSLYVRLGDEENKVANFQANWEAEESPEFRFTAFAFSGLFDKAHNSLMARFKAGEQADCPLKAPGLHWLTDEKETLFYQYSERLPDWG